MSETATHREEQMRAWMLAVLACALAAAALLRFQDLGLHSVWFDEAMSWSQARDGLVEMIRRTAGDNYPPLHNVLLWGSIKLFGDGAIAMRAPSALLSTLTVGAVFLLGRELAGPRAGLIAAVVLAVMPFEIEHARHARMYPLFSLTVTLYLWSVLRFARRPSRAGAMLSAAALLAMLYSHIYGSFVFAGVALGWNALYVFRRHIEPGEYWMFFRWHAAAIVIFAPWVVVLIERVEAVSHWDPWRPYPDAAHLARTVLDLFPPPALVFVGILLAIGAVRLLAVRDVRKDRLSAAAILAGGVIVPIVIGYVLSVSFKPMLISRYLIYVIPLLTAVSAAILVRLPLPRPVPWLAAGAVTAALAGPAVEAVYEPGLHGDWRALTEVWREGRSPEDGLIVYPNWAIVALEYHERDGFAVVSEPLTLEEATRPVDFDGRLWIAVRQDDPAHADAIVQAYRDAGYELEQRTEFNRLQLLALRKAP